MSEFRISRPDGGTQLKIVGELDVATAPRLTEALRDLRAGEVVLDLSELTFLDSCGTRALLELARARNGNGPVVICWCFNFRSASRRGVNLPSHSSYCVVALWMFTGRSPFNREITGDEMLREC